MHKTGTHRKFMSRLLQWMILFLAVLAASTGNSASNKKNDVHYSEAGFFDMHVCNWPGRELFFLVVFSTFKYDQIRSVTIFRPDGSVLGKMDLSRYKVVMNKGKPEKRAFINQFGREKGDANGWYRADVELANGEHYEARDYVEIRRLDMARAVAPRNEEELATPPDQIEWEAIPGARFYKLFIRDLWDDGRLIHESKLLKTHRYSLPKGLLNPGGWYSWKVHARDVNEDPRLGDFNHGSLSDEVQFTIQAPR